MKKSTEEIVSILKGSYELSESYQQVQAAISAICREVNNRSSRMHSPLVLYNDQEKRMGHPGYYSK